MNKAQVSNYNEQIKMCQKTVNDVCEVADQSSASAYFLALWLVTLVFGLFK